MVRVRLLTAAIAVAALSIGSVVAAVPASAEAIDASISGHITAPADATPIASLYQLGEDGYELSGNALVDAAGEWIIGVEEAGTYVLSYGDYKDEPLYATVFYGGVITDDPDEAGIVPITFAPGSIYEDLEFEMKTISLADMPVPALVGKKLIGQELLADTGDWGPLNVGLSYEWTRDDVPQDTDEDVYEIKSADLGHRIGVTVTAQGAGYETTERVNTVAVPRGKITGYTPKIKGSAVVGKTLRVAAKKWKPTAGKIKLSYRWYANGKAIKKATSPKYKIAASVRGKKITVKVTGKATGFTTVTRASKKSARVK
jgi:hypothetical protein